MTQRPIVRNELWRQVSALLDATGHPWNVENGKRHYQVYLAGKMIGVLSKGVDHSRDSRQLQSAIKRRMRELSAGENQTDNRGTLQGARV